MTDPATAPVDGFASARFAAVADTFRANFARFDEVGAAVAVVHRGELVVDLWGGYTHRTRADEWRRDTIVNVWSVTKTMTALCLLLLADRGALDVDAPVADYWPEFAANGKEGVLVRHVMAHTAGLPGWDAALTPDDVLDWDRACALLAAQAPWWTPGDGSGYHAMTQGFLCGELLRRITGSTLGAFFAREVAGPAGADFHIGTPQAHDHRIAPVIGPDSGALGATVPAEQRIARQALGNPLLPAEYSAAIGWRRAEMPASGGHGNARSVALAQHAVSHGGSVWGRRLLAPNTLEHIFREQCDGTDRVLLRPLRHGIGYGLPGGSRPLPSARACWWAGWGGSLCLNDLEHGFTFAYTMNRMLDGTVGDTRAADLVAATYRSVGV